MKQIYETQSPPLVTESARECISLLENAAIPEALRERIRRYYATLIEDGTTERMSEFLRVLHMSIEPQSVFSVTEWRQQLGREDDFPLEHSFLTAVGICANEFEGYGMTILWNTLAALGTRKDPHNETSILAIKETLPYPWYICDAALHAMGKSFALHFHVQSRIFAATGSVLLHGCGCSHWVPGPEEFDEMEIRFKLPRKLYAKCAQEFLDHLLAEATAIVRLGYPFRLNPEHLRSTEVLGLRSFGDH